LSLEILYFWLSGGDLRTGIGWDLIFIAINLYQIYRLMKDRLSLRLPEPDRELLRSVPRSGRPAPLTSPCVHRPPRGFENGNGPTRGAALCQLMLVERVDVVTAVLGKKPKSRPMTERTRIANARKSKLEPALKSSGPRAARGAGTPI